MPYNFTSIEKKWQRYWLENKSFRALDPAEAGDMPKAYVLDMFPYPSGAGLHVGHPEGYTATDIVSRFLRMKGHNVLHPMGWDAFGLPAEQYAIKTGQHPRLTTEQNIATFRRQIQMLGLSYDWDREVDTTDPDYYRWTQWIFLQLFNSYFDPLEKRAMPIEHLKTQLFNENYVVAPDGSVHLNSVQEGMEQIAGEVRAERLWRELSPEEQVDVLNSQRLAYMDEAPVNWCPALGTVLANEEVVDGRSEVGGFPVEKRPLRQWMLRITAYADRLIEDLDRLDWPHSLKEMQRNWIGKSVGAEVEFDIDPASIHGSTRVAQGSEPQPESTGSPRDERSDEDDDLSVVVFTTRPDTLYGATYMVLAPEHALVDRIAAPTHRETVDAYRTQVAAKSDRDRMADTKDKTGVFTGAFAINPVNQERIPIYIADYVLTGYGTGAIMAVPAHDERDFEFAKKFNLPVRQVVAAKKGAEADKDLETAYVADGYAVNSPAIADLPTSEAKTRMIDFLVAQGICRRSTNYKLRDWLFSRQRYWGEPFPILLDADDNPVAASEAELPITPPQMDDFRPTGTPEPPLSKAADWVNVSRDGAAFRRETNTMPQWAGSCWYYLRYIDPRNTQRFVDPEKEKYWMPVDLYVGGVEHAVLHLLYSRFWHKVLFDLGHVSSPEPFARLVNQGLILGEAEYHAFQTAEGAHVSTADLRDIQSDGTEVFAYHKQTGERVIGKRVAEDVVEKTAASYSLRAQPDVRVDARSFKMSKSRGNVVNPDDIVKDYGADTFRLYEMYMGPLEAQKPWNTRDIVGMARFLNGVWRNLVGDEEAGRVATISDEPPGNDPDRQLHQTISKVTLDITALRFNTAIAELIKLNNTLTGMPAVPRATAEGLVLLLAPFAPHIAEEIWQRLGHENSLARHPWPTFDPAKLISDTLELPVQVNGKLRGKVKVPADAGEATVLDAAAAAESVRSWLEGKTIAKRLYVPKKLVNFVVRET